MNSPQRKNWWSVNTFTRYLDNDSIEVNTPEGFTFRMFAPKQAIEVMHAMSLREIDILIGDSRFRLASDGSISVIDTDTWLNPDFEYGHHVCRAAELSSVLAKYLLETLDGRRT